MPWACFEIWHRTLYYDDLKPPFFKLLPVPGSGAAGETLQEGSAAFVPEDLVFSLGEADPFCGWHLDHVATVRICRLLTSEAKGFTLKGIDCGKRGHSEPHI